MTQGQIVADGEARKILTDPALALRASIVPPQITQVFLGLADLGFSKDVIDVSEAKKLLLERFVEVKR
jgi:hypothetical protein